MGIVRMESGRKSEQLLAIGNNLHSPFGALGSAVADVSRNSKIKRAAVNMHSQSALSLLSEKKFRAVPVDDPSLWPQCRR